MTRVLIRGDGVAAYTCAYLLGSDGCQVALERTDRPRLPAIMLTESALTLLRDVFRQPGLFRAAPRIRRRIVAWGKHDSPRAFDHRAVVVSEEILRDTLQSVFPCADADAHASYEWTVCSSRPLPVPAVEHRFGSRTAAAAKVELKNGSCPETCWVESHEDGWLFLIPVDAGSGWLLSAGSCVDFALGRSRTIADHIERVTDTAGTFFAGPRMVSSLYGPGWIACGTAAIGFDPLCGDGTAHAVREAILASAAIRSMARGGAVSELLPHYEARLIAGFQRHLALCQKFYATGYGGPWWDTELEALEEGLQWGAQKLRTRPAFQYRLNGFELEALA